MPRCLRNEVGAARVCVAIAVALATALAAPLERVPEQAAQYMNGLLAKNANKKSFFTFNILIKSCRSSFDEHRLRLLQFALSQSSAPVNSVVATLLIKTVH